MVGRDTVTVISNHELNLSLSFSQAQAKYPILWQRVESVDDQIGDDPNTSLAVHFTMKDWPAHNFAHSRIRTAIMTMDWPSGRSNCGLGMLRR